MNEFYTDYAEYMSRFFPGKVQKISVNLGTGCPNRDGTIGTGGCIYCDNSSFTPAYCREGLSPARQVEAGKAFFARKYPKMRYIVYFQAYTSTYRKSADELRDIYTQALDVDGVVGLAIGTRPDCLPDETLDMLAAINREKPVFVELGVESLDDATLRMVNRGHTAAQSIDAIRRLAAAGLHTGVHLIAGLPGESLDAALNTVERICRTPVESIKIHHLQVLAGTRLHTLWREGKIEIPSFDIDQYLDFCVKVVETVPRHIAIERFLASSPPLKVISPKWGMKNHEFTNLLINKLRQR